jgi:phytanoyl-CoA hydroxylase
MFSLLRRFKLAFAVYNFFHRDQLAHNVGVYKRLGLKKKYYSPVSSSDFKHLNAEPANPLNTDALRKAQIFQRADEESRQSMLAYETNGFCKIAGLFEPHTRVINAEIESLLERKLIKVGYGGKIMFAIHHSRLLAHLCTSPELLELLEVLMGGKARLFQSINFFKGSEQDSHSDSIHMTTYPQGGLLGVWIALEDINGDNGPLHYYPGSHKLPYYMNKDYQNEGNKYLVGAKSYTEYERMIEQKIAERGLKKEVFKAKRGDVLIWHANLVHGGEPHLNKNKTRQSMVLHYFREGAICYHEITQRPALIKSVGNH